jgi:plasmid stabilization system protein ParE
LYARISKQGINNYVPVIFEDRAVSDIQKAYDYLEIQQTNLGEKLLSSIEEYVDVIRIFPGIFKEDDKNKKVRQVRIKPFGYLLRYKVHNNSVIVVQLIHGKQSPRKKRTQ